MAEHLHETKPNVLCYATARTSANILPSCSFRSIFEMFVKSNHCISTICTWEAKYLWMAVFCYLLWTSAYCYFRLMFQIFMKSGQKILSTYIWKLNYLSIALSSYIFYFRKGSWPCEKWCTWKLEMVVILCGWCLFNTGAGFTSSSSHSSRHSITIHLCAFVTLPHQRCLFRLVVLCHQALLCKVTSNVQYKPWS